MPSTAREFFEHFPWSLAGISSFVTCYALLYQDVVNNWGLSCWDKAIILGGIFIICGIYACCMTHKKSRISIPFNPQFTLTIEKGDLFKKKGIIVIPVNEYFDTHVGDGIISPSSVHGMWINRYFKNEITRLDSVISNELASTPPKGYVPRTNGKSNKYELGTCIKVDEGDNTYVLMALTHFDQNNHAFLDRKEYPMVIDGLMSYLQRLQIEKPIYMPLIGSGLSRLRRSPQRILTFMVDAIDFKYAETPFPNGISIEIYDINQVNLNKIESLVKHELSL